MNAAVQAFHFEPGTLIEYDGLSALVMGFCKDGVIVTDRHGGEDAKQQHFVIEHSKIRELMTRIDVVIDQDFSRDDPDEAAQACNAKSLKAEWDRRSEGDRRKALQAEAWCIAARSVLKCKHYTETKVRYAYDEIRAKALDRQRLLANGGGKKGAFPAKDFGAKRVSQLCNLYYSWKTPTPVSLLHKKSIGNTVSRLSAAQNALLDKCCRKYLSKAQPSGKSIVRFVRRAFRAATAERRAIGDLRPFPVPHQNTIYKRLGRFSKLELVVGREGYQEAQKQFSPTQHGVRALKPGEMIELDFWKGDVFTLSKKSGFWDVLSPDLQKELKEGKGKGKKKTRQRLWVCAAIDVATRMVLGIGLAEKPNARTVIEVLDMVARDKSGISRLADCRMPWSQHCGIGTVIVDTGAEFFNEEVQAAIVALGASYIYGRAAVPMDKPFVERLFGGLRTMFADELPGKTGFSPQCLIDYDKEGMAVFNSDQLRHLITRYFVDFYPLEPHSGLLGKRPIDAWKDAQAYGVVPPPMPRVRRNATGLKLRRRLTKEGVKILGVPFGSPDLFPRLIRNGSHTVEVRLDPNDLREITILAGGSQVHLQNQRKDLARHSLRSLMAAIKKMTASRPQDRIFYEYVLADYADWIAQKIETGIDAAGLASTEISESELDWFENQFCLKLQIDANPEKAVSADINDLLSARPGAGIYSAEDIAREKAEARDALGNNSTPDVRQNAAALEPPIAGQPAQDGTEAALPDQDEDQEDSEPAGKPPAENSNSEKGRFTGPPKGKGYFK